MSGMVSKTNIRIRDAPIIIIITQEIIRVLEALCQEPGQRPVYKVCPEGVQP